MQQNIGKTRWKCRRGMLELDILLLNFFEARYAALTLHQQKVFDALLDQPDPVLYNWLLGDELPEDKEVKAMIKLIQKFPLEVSSC